MRAKLGFITVFTMLTCSLSAHGAESQAAINGAASGYAVIAPTFISPNGLSPDSYIRLFNGGSATSQFSVSLVGIPSGNAYGNTATVSVPSMASLQYSMGQLIALTAAGSLSAGDTSYAVYLKNSDAQSGYQHITYNGDTALFENLSSCNAVINQQMLAQSNNMVLTNVHTSKLANNTFPSTIRIHNYSTIAKTYRLKVYNAGSIGAGLSISNTAGKLTCQGTTNSVPANSSVSVAFSEIEASSACVLDADQNYSNVVISDDAGAPLATIAHLINVAAYRGDTNMSTVCAVNPVTTVVSGGTTTTSIVSNINGTFNGWTGSTTFTLTNGQVWQQSAYAYMYHYAFRPQVVIFAYGTGYKMAVEGADGWVSVTRVQ